MRGKGESGQLLHILNDAHLLVKSRAPIVGTSGTYTAY